MRFYLGVGKSWRISWAVIVPVVLGLFFAFNPAKAATTVVYPNADTETVSVDGRVYNTGGNASWSTVRSASAGSASSDSSTTGSLGAYYTSSLYYITRLFFTFDTAAIPDTDVISAVTLQLYGNGAPDDANTTDIDIVEATQASNTALVDGDFDQVGSTVFASKTIGSWNATGYNTFTLDSAGIAHINKTGVTKFGARIARDTDNSAPTGINLVSMYFADETGTSKDPVLTITHAPAGPTCGDGVVETPEVCDDGGTTTGDGCDDMCEVETGWTCDGADPTVCTEDTAGGSTTDTTDATAYTLWIGSFIIFAGVAFWPTKK